MTAKHGGQGNIWYKQVEGGRRESSSLSSSEEEGVEVQSKTIFRNTKFTSTSNPYCTNNGCTQKVICVLSSKRIINFNPIQAEAFVPLLAGRDAIRKPQTGTVKTLVFGTPDMTIICFLEEEKGNSRS